MVIRVVNFLSVRKSIDKEQKRKSQKNSYFISRIDLLFIHCTYEIVR